MTHAETIRELEQARAAIDEILQDLPHATDDHAAQVYVYGALGPIMARLDVLSGAIAAECGIDGHKPWAALVAEQAQARLTELYTAWQRRAERAASGYAVD